MIGAEELAGGREVFFHYRPIQAIRGAGTSEGQGGGSAFSKDTFNTVRTVITTNIAL